MFLLESIASSFLDLISKQLGETDCRCKRVLVLHLMLAFLIHLLQKSECVNLIILRFENVEEVIKEAYFKHITYLLQTCWV